MIFPLIQCLIIMEVVSGDQLGSAAGVQNECENPAEGKSFNVNFKKDSSMALEFKLSQSSKDMIDFSNGFGEVVLRIEIKTPNSTSGEYQLRMMSLRGTDNQSKTSQTVGHIDEYTLNIKPDSESIIISLKVFETNYTLSFGCRNLNGGIDHVGNFTRSHELPFETVVRAGLDDNATASICSKPDDCKGVCLTCPKGTHLVALNVNPQSSHSYNSTHRCDECGRGNFSDVVNSAVCEVCPRGQASNKYTATGCKECMRGSFADRVGSTKCTECESGTYSNVTGSDTCSICPKGYRTNREVGSVSCEVCPKGTYSLGSTNKCNNCYESSVAPSRGSHECIPCQYGRINSTRCKCATGTSRVDAATCETCKEGTYTPRPNMDTCLSCNGTITNGGSTCECHGHYRLVNETQCVPIDCDVGMYKDTDDTCKHCPPGTYNNVKGSRECTPCPKGFYQPFEKKTSCIECPVGTFQSRSGERQCHPCKAGTYQGKTGQPSCEFCHGSISSNICHTDVFDCPGISKTYPNIGKLKWQRGKPGTTVKVGCPLGSGIATRTCTNEGWLDPDVFQCDGSLSREIEEIIDKLPDDEDVSKEIETLVKENISKFAPKDIDNVAQVMDDKDFSKSKDSTRRFFEASVLLSEYESPLEHVVPASTKAKIVSVIEKAVNVMITKWETQPTVPPGLADINVLVSKLNHKLNNVNVQGEGDRTFSTIIYKNSKLFSISKNSDVISSNVYGVNIHGSDSANVSDELAVTMNFDKTLPGTPECRWFDTQKLSWSTKGCYIVLQEGDSITCQCSHLTSFAIFTSLSEVSAEHRKAQSILTTTLFVISILSLIVTLGVYLPLRSLRNKVVVRVEIMEILALLLANITFLVLSRVSHQSRVCHGLVFALQYFYLVTIAWSLVAAWTFYGQIVQAIHTYGKTYQNSFIISFILCWTLPVIIPMFAMVYSVKNNISYVSGIDGEFGCWLDNTWKVYTFIIPIVIIVAINTVLGVRVILVMLGARSRSKSIDKWENYKRHVKSVISLLTIFGTSFLLALFTYGPHSIVFQYIFICFTCTQGFWIFVFLVPLRPEVQTEWRNFLFRNLVNSPSTGRTTRTDSSSILAKRLSAKFSSQKKEAPADKVPLEQSGSAQSGKNNTDIQDSK